MATNTRLQLGYFIDAAVERLDERDLRMTAITKHSWDGLDKGLVDRILWELEDRCCEEVAREFNVTAEFVEKLSHLAGANGRIPAR